MANRFLKESKAPLVKLGDAYCHLPKDHERDMPLCTFGMLCPRQFVAFHRTKVPGLTIEVNAGKYNPPVSG